MSNTNSKQAYYGVDLLDAVLQFRIPTTYLNAEGVLPVESVSRLMQAFQGLSPHVTKPAGAKKPLFVVRIPGPGTVDVQAIRLKVGEVLAAAPAAKEYDRVVVRLTFSADCDFVCEVTLLGVELGPGESSYHELLEAALFKLTRMVQVGPPADAPPDCERLPTWLVYTDPPSQGSQINKLRAHLRAFEIRESDDKSAAPTSFASAFEDGRAAAVSMAPLVDASPSSDSPGDFLPFTPGDLQPVPDHVVVEVIRRDASVSPPRRAAIINWGDDRDVLRPRQVVKYRYVKEPEKKAPAITRTTLYESQAKLFSAEMAKLIVYSPWVDKPWVDKPWEAQAIRDADGCCLGFRIHSGHADGRYIKEVAES